MKNSHWVHSLGQQLSLPYLDKEINLVCNLEVSALTLPKGEVQRDLFQDVSFFSRLFVRSSIVIFLLEHASRINTLTFLFLILKCDW